MNTRPMRRKRQLLSKEDTEAILLRGTSGVLAVQGDDGYPYAVPMSYLYMNGKLYFHGAKSGYKMDCIRSCPKASFCVIDQDQIVEAEYTTYFRSAIAFGQVRLMEDEAAIHAVAEQLGIKYNPGASMEYLQEAIQKEWSILAMFEMEIESMTGKEAIELVRAKEAAGKETNA